MPNLKTQFKSLKLHLLFHRSPFFFFHRKQQHEWIKHLMTVKLMALLYLLTLSTISPWLLSSLPHLLIWVTATDIQIICLLRKSINLWINPPTVWNKTTKLANSSVHGLTPLLDIYIVATHTHRHTKSTSLLWNEMSRSNGKHNFWCFSIHLYIYRTKAQQGAEREQRWFRHMLFFCYPTHH